jgi:DNA-binding IclR family transcriptional regulator
MPIFTKIKFYYNTDSYYMKQKPAKGNPIEKTLAILLSFSPYNQEIGTVEINQKLGFHKPTVSRILVTSTRSAFLEKNPQTKKFRLGPSIGSLESAANRSVKTNMVRIAKPHTDELRDIPRETIVLEVPSEKRKLAHHRLRDLLCQPETTEA